MKKIFLPNPTGSTPAHGNDVMAPMTSLRRLFQRPNRPEPNIVDMNVPTQRLGALRSDDQFIVSYPRSGNTWMRNLVRNVIVLGRPSQTEPEKLWMLIPDLHISEHAMEHEAHTQFGLTRRILKSHNLAAIQNHRLLYVFRRPADALVSYYHFHLLHPETRDKVQDGLEKFCDRMVTGWGRHVQLALSIHAKAPERAHFVSYEMLTKDAPNALSAAVKFLGFAGSKETIGAAIERSTFERLRRQEEATRTESGNEYFFRRGKVGSAQEELTPAMLEKIKAQTEDIYASAVHAALASAAKHGESLRD